MGILDDGRAGSRPGQRFRLTCSNLECVARRVSRVFERLDGISFIGPEERREFRYYEGLFAQTLGAIDRKAAEGRLHPLDLSEFPRVLRYPGGEARVGVFIGSFDPFQMTHLAACLKFLASPDSEADVIFVIPEGMDNPDKPNKTEYRFRYELMRAQLEGVFMPLIVPLDVGADADTIRIVERIIALHAGMRLKLTHLLGSDALPTAVRFLGPDLEAWREAARRSGVELDHGIFTALRDPRHDARSLGEAVRRMGARFVLDESPIGTPSSTDFREGRFITIAFPTEAVLSRLELLFRYGMNRPWMRPEAPGEPEYSI